MWYNVTIKHHSHIHTFTRSIPMNRKMVRRNYTKHSKDDFYIALSHSHGEYRASVARGGVHKVSVLTAPSLKRLRDVVCRLWLRGDVATMPDFGAGGGGVGERGSFVGKSGVRPTGA